MPFDKLKQYIKGIQDAAQKPEVSVMDKDPNEEPSYLQSLGEEAKRMGKVGLAALPDTSLTIPEYQVPTSFGTVKSPELTVDPMAMGSVSKVGKVASMLEEAANAKKLGMVKPMLKEAEYAQQLQKVSPQAQQIAQSLPVVETGKEAQKLLSGEEWLAKQKRILDEKAAARQANKESLENLSASKAPRDLTEVEALRKYDDLSEKVRAFGRDASIDPEVEIAKQQYLRIKNANAQKELSKSAKLEAVKKYAAKNK